MNEGIVESSFFKINKYKRFSLFDKLPGFQRLTRYDIRKDLREIERTLLWDDTDSDSSIKSEDILQSSYPVKPRRTHRAPASRTDTREKQISDLDKDSAVLAAADDALNFLRAIKLSKVELHHAEVEREKLETALMSYERAIEDKTNTFGTSKKEQENYLQLLQALYSKLIIQNIAYSQQNSMVYDLMETMQRRRNAAEVMENECKKLKACSQVKSARSTSMKQLGYAEGETAMLRVFMKKANKEVVLYKGEWIKTPMGLGQITCIQPMDHRVTIQLPFGKMYSCLERVVCWGGLQDRLDATSDKALTSSWISNRNVNIPIEKRTRIRKLLGHTEDVDDFTDQDDDSSSDPVETVNPPVAAEEQGSASVPSSSTVLEMKPTDNSIELNPAEHYDQMTSHEKSLQILGIDSGNGKKIFPLLANPTNTTERSQIVAGRQRIRKSFHDDILSDAINHKSLTMAFIPPPSIPTVVETFENPNTEHRVEFCKHAFTSADHGKLGSTSSLAWNGNLDEMMKALQQSEKGITKLESEVKDFINISQSNSTRSLRLMKEISAIRLAMFTKRIRHRNNLGARDAQNQNPAVHAAVKEEMSVKRENASDKASSTSLSASPVRDMEPSIPLPKKRGRDQYGDKKSERSRGISEIAADMVEMNGKRNGQRSSALNGPADGLPPLDTTLVDVREDIDNEEALNSNLVIAAPSSTASRKRSSGGFANGASKKQRK